MKFLRNTLALFHLILIAVLALSCSASYVMPNTLWWLQLFGLAFPLLYIANLVLMLVWIWRKKKFVFVPLIAAAVSFKQASVTFGIGNSQAGQDGVKLMTWNVKNFDLYNWSHNAKTRNQMLNIIQSENPDIICFQEFYTDNQRIFDNFGYFRDTLGYNMHFNVNGDWFRAKWKKRPLHQQWGLAIASRFPIINEGVIEFENAKSNGCSFVDLQVGSNLIRVYTMHLQSIKLNYADYENLEEIEQGKSIRWYELGKIVDKMKAAYVKRAKQVQLIGNSIAKCPYPYILTGDFNDVPVSYSYASLSANMSDAFIKQGLGIGGTLPGKFGLFRIDYVLGSQQVQFGSYNMIKHNLSDHYPVIVKLSLTQ